MKIATFAKAEKLSDANYRATMMVSCDYVISALTYCRVLALAVNLGRTDVCDNTFYKIILWTQLNCRLTGSNSVWA